MMETDIVVGTGLADDGLKATVSRSELAERLAVVTRAVSTRSAVQVLLGVLVRAEGGRLHFAATDMELSLRTSVEADVADEGAVVVPGKLLFDIVRQLPEAEIAIEHRPEEGSVHSSVASASYRVAHLCRRGLSAPPRGRDDPHALGRSRARCSTRSHGWRARPRVTSRDRC